MFLGLPCPLCLHALHARHRTAHTHGLHLTLAPLVHAPVPIFAPALAPTPDLVLALAPTLDPLQGTVAGPTPAPSHIRHAAEVTRHRALARDLPSAAPVGMHRTVGPDLGREPSRALQRDAARPALTRAVLAAARSAVQALDQSLLRAEDRLQLFGETEAIRDLRRDRYRLLVGNPHLGVQGAIPQHLHLLRLVVVTGLLPGLARPLLEDGVTTPGIEASRELLLAADERMYHCQRSCLNFFFVPRHEVIGSKDLVWSISWVRTGARKHKQANEFLSNIVYSKSAGVFALRSHVQGSISKYHAYVIHCQVT